MRIRWLCSFQIWPGNCSWSIEDSDELLAFSSIPLYRIAVTMGNIRCWKQKWGAHFWAFLNSLNVHGSSLAHLLLVFLNSLNVLGSSLVHLLLVFLICETRMTFLIVIPEKNVQERESEGWEVLDMHHFGMVFFFLPSKLSHINISPSCRKAN